MTTRNAKHRIAVGRCLAIAVGIMAILLPAQRAETYRFFHNGVAGDPRAVRSENAIAWDEFEWDQGQTITFDVPPDPDFAPAFGGPEPLVEELRKALAAWSSIPTADISWQVSGVGAPIDGDPNLDHPSRDGRNTLTLYAGPDAPGGGYAEVWQVNKNRGDPTSPEVILECDVVMGRGFKDFPAHLTAAKVRAAAPQLITHELGHCLGLAHTDGLSMRPRPHGAHPFHPDAVTASYGVIHPGDPTMSYGVVPPEGLTMDDKIGASLLRPAPGWDPLSIGGTIEMGGQPVPYAHVWALPADGDGLEDRIGVYSDGSGRFLIEGLAAGDYALWAQPLIIWEGQGDLVAEGAPVRLDETIYGGVVAAGSPNIRITMRAGRHIRPNPDQNQSLTPASQLTSVIGSDADICSGVRVTASERPYLADGPRWFSRRDDEFREFPAHWIGTRLSVEWAPGSGAVTMDWDGPYRDWTWDGVSVRPGVLIVPHFDLSVSDWQTTRSGSTVRHSFDVAWPDSAEATLRFRSSNASCSGEPLLICNRNGCGISR